MQKTTLQFGAGCQSVLIWRYLASEVVQSAKVGVTQNRVLTTIFLIAFQNHSWGYFWPNSPFPTNSDLPQIARNLPHGKILFFYWTRPHRVRLAITFFKGISPVCHRFRNAKCVRAIRWLDYKSDANLIQILWGKWMWSCMRLASFKKRGYIRSRISNDNFSCAWLPVGGLRRRATYTEFPDHTIRHPLCSEKPSLLDKPRNWLWLTRRGSLSIIIADSSLVDMVRRNSRGQRF